MDAKILILSGNIVESLLSSMTVFDATSPLGYWVKYNPWISRLFEDPVFADQVATRYAYYYNNMNYLLDKIDSLSEYIYDSQAKNFDIWQTMGKYVWPNPVVFDTYEEEVAHLKQWLTTRMNWLNEEFR